MSKGKIKFQIPPRPLSVLTITDKVISGNEMTYKVNVTEADFIGFIVLFIDAYENIKRMSVSDTLAGFLSWQSTESTDHKEKILEVKIPIGIHEMTLSVDFVKKSDSLESECQSTVAFSEMNDYNFIDEATINIV